MAEDQGKEEEKFDFTLEGEAVGYISLDQARVLAMRHARENTDFYGEVYGQQELTWEELSAEEGEDYYRVRVSYRPIRGFDGTPGVELFTIDKSGPVEIRQILQEPRLRPRFPLPVIAAGVIALVAGLVGGLFAAGVFSPGASGPDGVLTSTSVTAPLSPVVATELVSPSGDATISVPPGAADGEHSLTYSQLTPADLPELPDGFTATGRAFDLSVAKEGGEEIAGFSFKAPITVTVTLTAVDVVLAGSDETRLVIQHYREGSGWEALQTTADFKGMSVTAQVETLSPFALTIKEPEPTPTPRPTPTFTPVPSLTPTPTSVTPTSTPIAVATATAISTPTTTPVMRYRLDAVVSPERLGSIRLLPDSPDQRYPSGSTVVVSVSCDTAFLDWAGDVSASDSGSNRLTVAMDKDKSLVATCAEPTATPTPTPTPMPTNTPTPVPTATPRPTPTPMPVPGFILRVNGLPVLAGQIVVKVPGGNVVLYQLAQSNGAYIPGSTVNMEARPDVTGSPITWQGVNSQDGAWATVVMRGERFVSANIMTLSSTPTPVPSTTGIPTPTPTLVPTLGPTATPTHTPTPQPPGEPTHTPTPTPTPAPTATPMPTATPTPTPTPSSSAVFVSKWGTGCAGDGQFKLSYGVAVASDGSVYVADYANNCVQEFTAEGVFVSKWGTYGSGDGQFTNPHGVAVASDGSVFVADEGNHRIQRFTSEGVFITKWGTEGPGDGQFQGQLGVAVASDGSVYVSDWSNHRIQKFTSEGVFVTKWGTEGPGDGQFQGRLGVAVASDGSVYVSGSSHARIQRFTSEGVFVTKWGTQGAGDGQFINPHGVAVASDGSVYVADYANNRVQKFTAEGVFVSKWGTYGSGDGQFKYPTAVAVASDGSIYVADYDNDRIQRFSVGQ